MASHHIPAAFAAIAVFAGACARDRPYEVAMKHAIDGGDAPGIAVARIRDGHITVATEGVADVARGTPVTPDTAFMYFSVTKLFTAAAVMQLVERGAVGLDDPIERHVALPIAEGGRITVRHLLAHTSGLQNPFPISWVHLEDERGPALEELTMRLLRAHPRLRFEPGSRYGYSNLGYLVLGVLVERRAGLPFEAYVLRHVLEPLGMRSTGFDLGGKTLATGYYRRSSMLNQAMRLVVDGRLYGPRAGRFGAFRRFLVDGAPYGGLVGSCTDLARFAAALAGDGAFEGARILTPASTATMRERQRTPDGEVLAAGLAWRYGETDGIPDLRVVGGGGGFKTEVRIRLDGSAAVVCANETLFDTGPLAAAGLRRGQGRDR
jgi:CubicO group peptidase (beta-lactamase class C family)